jgi:hypothetical protein
MYKVRGWVRSPDPVPGCDGGLEAIGVMEDSEPASMAAGMSYAMFAGYAPWYKRLSNKAIEVMFKVVIRLRLMFAAARVNPEESSRYPKRRSGSQDKVCSGMLLEDRYNVSPQNKFSRVQDVLKRKYRMLIGAMLAWWLWSCWWRGRGGCDVVPRAGVTPLFLSPFDLDIHFWLNTHSRND